jgi:hypothetical protein
MGTRAREGRAQAINRAYPGTSLLWRPTDSDGCDFCVFQDKPWFCCLGEMKLILSVEKGILLPLKRFSGWLPTSVLAEDGFGHEVA